MGFPPSPSASGVGACPCLARGTGSERHVGCRAGALAAHLGAFPTDPPPTWDPEERSERRIAGRCWQGHSWGLLSRLSDRAWRPSPNPSVPVPRPASHILHPPLSQPRGRGGAESTGTRGCQLRGDCHHAPGGRSSSQAGVHVLRCRRAASSWRLQGTVRFLSLPASRGIHGQQSV